MSDEPQSPPEMDEPLDADLANEVIQHHGYLSWLGIEFDEIVEGRVVVTLPYRDELANWVTGTIHGGITATVVDTASAFALRTCMDDPTTTLATTDLNVKYVRPATDDLRVDAEVIRAGTSTGVTRVTVSSTDADGQQKEVAIGTTTYRLFTDSEL